MKCRNSTVVEHSPYNPKAKGLSPSTAAGIGRKKMMKKDFDIKTLGQCTFYFLDLQDYGSKHDIWVNLIKK
jgi:hypothetical protein